MPTTAGSVQLSSTCAADPAACDADSSTFGRHQAGYNIAQHPAAATAAATAHGFEPPHRCFRYHGGLRVPLRFADMMAGNGNGFADVIMTRVNMGLL